MVSMGKESVGGVAVCGLALKEICILLICMLNQSYQVNSTKSGAELRVIINKAIFRIVYMNLSVVVVGPQVHIPLSFPG